MPRHARTSSVLPIALRELEVLRVAELTPGMRRVTLTGVQLGAHETAEGIRQAAFESDGFDDDIRLIFPYPGESRPVLPALKEGALIYPKSPKVLTKVYTVRRYDREARELDIDFVTHGVGIATTWASRTAPGDRIHILGPFRTAALPEGFDWLLAVGDETALPAIARLLEQLPETARGQVFIEIADDAHKQELRSLPGVRVTWCSRDGAEPGTTPVLLEAVRGASWWEGEAFAWVAGEQASVRDLRRHLVDERGLDKSAIDFTGYWKRHVVVALASDAAVPDPEHDDDAYEKFHEMSELLPPLAIRTAVNLGIAEHIARGARTVSALAVATATDERALAKFLRYLTAIELLETGEDGRHRLTETGEFLTADYVTEQLHRDGVQGRKERALHGLEHAVRTGGAAYAHVTGSDYAVLRTRVEFERALLDETAQYAGNYVTPLADASAFAGARHVVVHSNGAAALAAALVARYSELRVTLPALPTMAAWLRDDLPGTIPDQAQRSRVQIREQSLFEPTDPADAVVIAYLLAEHPDPEAALILRRAAGSLAPGGKLLLSEATLDADQFDEHDAEYDLLNLTLHGSGHRTPAELAAVIATAGLAITATEIVGWGTPLHELSAT